MEQKGLSPLVCIIFFELWFVIATPGSVDTLCGWLGWLNSVMLYPNLFSGGFVAKQSKAIPWIRGHGKHAIYFSYN